MTPPASQLLVSVEETENGYIVHAGSAVATISRTLIGYAVDAGSQVLKEEYNLSPGVQQVRKSARDSIQFSVDSTDETRLILQTSRSFLFLYQAVEMVCGFLPELFPKEEEWKLISAWKNKVEVVSEPEPVAEPEISNNTPETIPVEPVREKFGTTLSDIVSAVEDEVDSEYQSHSWRIKSTKSAEKILDKSAFAYHETGVPKDICYFFGTNQLPAGGKKQISLINNSKQFTGYLIKDSTKSERVTLRWDAKVATLISDFRKRNGDNLSLEFLKMCYPDTYNIILKRIVGAISETNKTLESSVSEEKKDDTNSTITSVSESIVTYSPDILRIHEAVSKLPRYHFDPATKIDIDNGLIVVFEDGEKYGEYDRIVYVGINKKTGKLPDRINKITSGKKEDVVLRQYLGTALLRKDGHNYARIWAKDSSSPEALRRIGTFYDPVKEDETEARVSAYLKEHMSFSVVEIPNSTRRTLVQGQLVATLKEAYIQLPLLHIWMGRYHPDEAIRTGYLWMKGDKRARPFNEDELNSFLNEVLHSVKLQNPGIMDLMQNTLGSNTSEPDLLMRVTVSLVGSSYAVNFRNATAKITPVDGGYSLDIGSQIFNKDSNLSERIRNVREAIRMYHSLWKEVDTKDEVLTICSPFVFPHISDALETICGCMVSDVPYDRVFTTLPSWIGVVDEGLERAIPAEPRKVESPDEPQKKESSDSERIEKTYYSWSVLAPGKVRKIVDKSCLEYNGSAIPTNVRTFFHVDNLKIGESQIINLNHNAVYYTARITANIHGRVRLFWDKKFGTILEEHCKLHPESSALIFEKGRKIHNYIVSFESNMVAKATKNPAPSPAPVSPLSVSERKTEYEKEAEDDFLKEATLIGGYLVKKITATVISSKKFMLPANCLSFFAADDMKSGEAKRITIKYDGKEGQAQIYKNDASKGKYARSTSLTWNDALNAYIKRMSKEEDVYFCLEKSILDDDTYRLKIEKIT